MTKKKISKETLLFFIMFAFMGFFFHGMMKGDDVWWHIKAGEWMVRNRAVPSKDIFSWTGGLFGLEWTAHEWLSEVIFYLLYSTGGEALLYIVSFLLAALMFFLLRGECRKYAEASPIVTVAFYAFFAASTKNFYYARPQLFSGFCLFAELLVLKDLGSNENSKKIWLLPLIAVLWSNLHGGTAVLSYVLPGIVLASSAADLDIGRIEGRKISKRNLFRLAAVTVLSAAGLLVNPVGWKVLLYPFAGISDQLQMTFISEWQAPDAKNIIQLLLYFAPVVLVNTGLIVSHKKIRLADLLFSGFFVFLFLRSIRFISLWFIAAPFCAFPYLLPEKQSGDASAFYYTGKTGRGVKAVCALLALSAVVMVSLGIAGDGIIQRELSEEMTDFVLQEKPERLFNDYNAGGELIFEGVPVFFDARADLYSGPGILADGFGLMLLQDIGGGVHNDETVGFSAENVIDYYGIDALLINRARPLYFYLMSHPEKYEPAKEDAEYAYFRVRS